MKLKKSAKAHKTLSMTVVLEGVMSIRIRPSWSHSLLWVPPTFGQQQFFSPTVLEIVKYLSMVSGHSSLCKSLPVCVSTQL